MAISSPNLWAVWAAFGLVMLLVTYRFVQAAVRTPIAERAAPPDPGQPWLYCEEGAPLDLEVRWFRVRPGGRTVLGSRPRSATAETSYIFLNAHGLAEDHAVIRYDEGTGRYRLQAPPGALVRHNNEELAAGEEPVLTDGDTLALADANRFRFTLAGPEGMA
jgi:hypothetical protein